MVNASQQKRHKMLVHSMETSKNTGEHRCILHVIIPNYLLHVIIPNYLLHVIIPNYLQNSPNYLQNSPN